MKRMILACCTALAACSQQLPDLPKGEQAYRNFSSTPPEVTRDYRIGPFDTIAVNVFQEPDLTAREVQVDAAGSVLLPLIGSVSASNKTASELAQEISQKLAERYLENPQVSVLVQTSVSQKVTVEGSVTEPGVYEIKGHTTLVDALAMARGPSRVARLTDVVIFRDINGQRMGALFDLAKIRRGEAADPEVVGQDTIIVGLSNVKAAWRDVLIASPLIAAFRPAF